MIVKPLPKQNLYELVEPLVFWIVYDDDYSRCEVPAGFVFDGASVPRFFWRVVSTPFQPKVMRAACIHDYLYRNHIVEKDVADEKFKSVLIADGVDKERAETMFTGVRLGGKSAYRNGPKKPLIGV